MTTRPTSATAGIIPCLRYRDATAAIDWLCHAFGFERRLVVPGPNGTVAHAQLTCGQGMVMLSSVTDSEFGRLLRQPDEFDGCETQCCFVRVVDADAVHARAQAAGARIVVDIRDEEYGGRGFTCRNPEGHVWYVGSYDPWAD